MIDTYKENLELIRDNLYYLVEATPGDELSGLEELDSNLTEEFIAGQNAEQTQLWTVLKEQVAKGLGLRKAIEIIEAEYAEVYGILEETLGRVTEMLG